MYLEDKNEDLKPIEFMSFIRNHLVNTEINSDDFIFIFKRFIEVSQRITEIKKRDDKGGEILQK